MKFEDFMKDITRILGKYKVENVSFELNTDTSKGRIDISPYGNKVDFEMATLGYGDSDLENKKPRPRKLKM